MPPALMKITSLVCRLIPIALGWLVTLIAKYESAGRALSLNALAVVA
jgi:hypothetical protein